MSRDLLLEIGTEEIPAGFMDNTFKQMRNIAKNLFDDNRIEIGDMRVTGTPRRLVLIVKDIEEKQADLEKEVRGPAKRIAFNEEGEPTPAGGRFC